MYYHKIVNADTGEETMIQLSDNEVKKIEANIAKAETEKAESILRAEARAALLNRLGITEAEAKLLLS